MPFNTATSALNGIDVAFGAVSENVALSKNIGLKPKTFTFLGTVPGNSQSTGSYTAGTVNVKVRQNNDVLGFINDGSHETHFAFDSPKGFAVVTSNIDDPLSGISYTRACDFTPDKAGNLVNSAGQFLMGWSLDQTTGEVPSNVNTNVLSSLQPINVQRVSGTFTPTTEMITRVTLPAVDANNAVLATGTTKTMNSTVVDTLGVAHNVIMSWTKTATANQWSLDISSPDTTAGTVKQGNAAGNQFGGATPVLVNFDNSGRLLNFEYPVGTTSTTAPDVYFPWTSTTAAPSTVQMDLGDVAANDGLRIMGNQYIVTKNENNGREFSSVEGVYIDPKGVLSTISRGNSLKMFQIAVANFNAPNELEPESGNSFKESASSGSYVLGFPGSPGIARIMSGKLEANPVSLADQLTKMIEMQHLYAINTRSIQTEDKMLERLTSI